MAGMYHLKDLLSLAAQEGAEELLLEPDRPVRMRLHGKVRVVDGPLLTSDQINEMVCSIATEEQRRELELCGEAHFRYVAAGLAQFSVRAWTEEHLLKVSIQNLGR